MMAGRAGPKFRTFQVSPKDARESCADYGVAISVIGGGAYARKRE
jgi:hypothetical protein